MSGGDISNEMLRIRLTRRALLRTGAAGIGLALAGACAPVPGPVPELETKEPAEPAPPERVLLRIVWHPDRDRPVADLFAEEQPSVDIEFLHITGIDHEEVAAKTLSLLAAGETLDMAYAATEATQLYAGQGLSYPLDDLVMRDEGELREYFSDVHPSLVEAMMYEGSIYQLPFSWNGVNMYYNTALFEENGIDHPPDDWTVGDFVEIARTVTRRDAAGETGVFGYGWTNRLWGSWGQWMFVQNSNLVEAERVPGGAWLWDTFYKDDPAARGRGGGWRWMKPMANDPRNVEVLELMQQLTREGTAPDIVLGGGATLQGFFSANKLAMTPAGGFWAGALYNAGMQRGSFDVQLWPKGKSQRHQFGTGSFFIFTASAHRDMAWEFNKFRCRAEVMEVQGQFSPVLTTTPARRSQHTEERFAETGPEHWKVFYDTLDKHPDTEPIPAPPCSNPMTTLFTSYTGLAISLEMTAQEALDAMQRELEELFGRWGDMYNLEG